MTAELGLMSEQSSLFERDTTDPTWTGRLSADDAVSDLGDTFIVNGLVTPVRTAVTALIAPQAMEAATSRLQRIALTLDDDLFLSASSGNPDAPAFFAMAELSDLLGLDLSGLPRPYTDWRLSVEIYVLFNGAVYLIMDDFALRYRVLSVDESDLSLVQRLLPFVTSNPEDMTANFVFLVTVPKRLAALGGLRGHRRALIDAGSAANSIRGRTRVEERRWIWETEFYDDTCARILGVDGVERVPTHVAYQVLPTDSDELTS